MPTQELISVSEYLATHYDPDCDYVDGVVLERNVGEEQHSRLQTALIAYIHARRKEWRAHVYAELRVQVSPTRFRVPDVCVVLGPRPAEQILTHPPFICIEVLSPEDRLAATREKVQDYLKMGVPYVWIIDPVSREAWRCVGRDSHEASEFRTENPEIVIPLSALFEED
jgi:Uma2 family endonuclease